MLLRSMPPKTRRIIYVNESGSDAVAYTVTTPEELIAIGFSNERLVADFDNNPATANGILTANYLSDSGIWIVSYDEDTDGSGSVNVDDRRLGGCNKLFS